MTTYEQFMREALFEASRDDNEVPVGAVVVRDGKIIARAHNEREKNAEHPESPFAHAEMLAMARACDALGTRRLRGCTLYVTLEPCPMCAGGILLSEIDLCVFGAFDGELGCCGSVYHLPADPALRGSVPCFGGVLENECRALLTAFFARRR